MITSTIGCMTFTYVRTVYFMNAKDPFRLTNVVVLAILNPNRVDHPQPILVVGYLCVRALSVW